MNTAKLEIRNIYLFWTGVTAMAKTLSAILAEWLHRHSSRRQLAVLPDHVLKDIGISRCEAEQEAAKPFWRQ